MRLIGALGHYAGVLRDLRLYGPFKVLKLASVSNHARLDATETKVRVHGQF